MNHEYYVDGAIFAWDSSGAPSATAPVAVSDRNWIIFGDEFRSVFAWDSSGAGSSPPPVVPSNSSPNNWLVYADEFSSAIVWESSGASGDPVPPVPVATATPGFPTGRTSRGRTRLPNLIKREDEAEKKARRIREGTLPPEPATEPDKFTEAIAKLKREEAGFRAEAVVLREKVAKYEAADNEKQAAKARKELLVKEQSAQLAKIQEEMLAEQQEVAEIALIVLMVLKALE